MKQFDYTLVLAVSCFIFSLLISASFVGANVLIHMNTHNVPGALLLLTVIVTLLLYTSCMIAIRLLSNNMKYALDEVKNGSFSEEPAKNSHFRLRLFNAEMTEKLSSLQTDIYLDKVTSIPNRRALYRHFDELSRNHADQHHYICLFDIDRFKAINDTYGHVTGDELLASICQRITGSLADGEQLFRLAGDEFVIITSSDYSNPYFPATLKLDNLFKLPFAVTEHVLYTGISYGCSEYGADGTTLDALLAKADEAMYEQKRTRHGNESQPVKSIT
ncbi:GGDEF domain-containing protein [Macrococcus equipercicus]|uniref:GGDEF domain-containing protein n=1 Tax=Macrococcus equipercicus TaxID=69967 RepID=A0ABQ6R864_9STAP|nr:GGDEF domain-containing protein [Macrococcus equipercicus]KAA1039298.1 GGDEF domain-containing protein [Macrococcus equipercicus]